MNDVKEYSKAEDAFRMMAFTTYYYKALRGKLDPTVRFVRAIVLSARKIPDRAAVLAWYRAKKDDEIEQIAIDAKERRSKKCLR